MRMWKEFRSFALGGSMLDLALGFIIGAAFAGLIDSMANQVISPLIATIFGSENLGGLHGSIAGGPRIYYGEFLTAVINFMLFALILFLFLKFIATIGMGRRRDFTEKQCPYCMEYIPPQSLVCKVCCSSLVAQLPDVATAEERLEKLRERHAMKLPVDLRDFELPEMKDINLSKIRRRPSAKSAAPAVSTPAPTADGSPEH
jgi:large conductance mechanosensitive channel